MIQGNKISQTELLVARRSQRFTDFVFSLRKQSLGHPQKSTYVPRLYEKSVGDNALRYKYSVNVGNRAFFHDYQLPSHCFLPTQRQLDKHLKQSRMISQRSHKQTQLQSMFQQKSLRQIQAINDNGPKSIRINSGRIVRGRKALRDPADQNKQKYQDSNQKTQNSRYQFRNNRQIRSQYFEAKKYNDVSIQHNQFPYQQTQQYNNFQSTKSLINDFHSMPSIPQNPQIYQRKIYRKKQPGKLYKKIPQNDMLDQLLQQRPLKILQ